jgi:hypothetical protein
LADYLFSLFVLPSCFSVILNCTCRVRAVHISPPNSPCFLVIDLAKSMPLEFSLFLSPFYRRLYFSSGLVLILPSLPSLTPSPLFRLVDIAYSPLSRWSSSGYIRAAVFFLFIPIVLYNHRITSDHIHLTSFFQFFFSPFFLKKHSQSTYRINSQARGCGIGTF